MGFLDENHKIEIRKINRLWNNLRELSALAATYGIEDIFQDNGAKVLQQLIYMNMQNLKGREGNDAKDINGLEWEMKSINTLTSASGFSTNHHLNYVILNKYRKVPWSFAIYHGIELQAIYVMSPTQLRPMFEHWKNKLDGGMPSINNPKIPIKFVKENGTLIYSKNEPNTIIDPTTVI